jgi:hypothetical protein
MVEGDATHLVSDPHNSIARLKLSPQGLLDALALTPDLLTPGLFQVEPVRFFGGQLSDPMRPCRNSVLVSDEPLELRHTHRRPAKTMTEP